MSTVCETQHLIPNYWLLLCVIRDQKMLFLKKNMRVTKLHIMIFLIGMLAGTFLLPQSIFAATKYWIGSAGGSFSSNANWSTSSGGSNDTTAPGSGDIATFDSGGNTNCTIDANVTIGGLNLTATYSRTLT